jgi:thymidylate synthase (FAD)
VAAAELSDITFRSDMTVELVKSSANDADVLFAARVSTKGEQSLEDVHADPERSKGLINYLMRDRHGCYDEQTEVLTSQGWKHWPDVHGGEEFATLSPDGQIEFDPALRLIAKPYDGPMVRIEMAHVDLLVTPEHRVLAKRRRQEHNERWELIPASDLLTACHRLRMGGGDWNNGYESSMRPGCMALLGFFIGEGNLPGAKGTPSFHLRKRREIDYLYAKAAEAGFQVRRGAWDHYHLIADEEFRLLAKKCYDQYRAKVVPWEVLDCDPPDLREMLDGLLHSDGSVSASGKQTYSTTSYSLAGQIQEVALKAGRAAVIHERPHDNDPGHYDRKRRFCVTIYGERWLQPKVGWTTEARRRQVTVEHYSGKVYCVTVPNGTLYVRRNGKPLWCGNSPFEHNSMTFFVAAPIFVFREFMRHRVNSYNEESGRYRELRPVFYVPGPDRKLVQQGKPGHYTFTDGSPEQQKLVGEATREVCRRAYGAYLEMLDAGIAREVARIVLPLTIYSSMYVTMNARALMNFLSLRTSRPDSAFPSYPQREIEMVAEQMETAWAQVMPLTHAAFDANGRVAP